MVVITVCLICVVLHVVFPYELNQANGIITGHHEEHSDNGPVNWPQRLASENITTKTSLHINNIAIPMVAVPGHRRYKQVPQDDFGQSDQIWSDPTLNAALIGSTGRQRNQFVGSGFGQEPLGGYCPSGMVAYINPTNNYQQGCPQGIPCPAGFSCQISSTRQNLCCARAGQCPNGQSVATNSFGQPISCAGVGSRTCPTPSFCIAASLAQRQYLCCQTGSTNTGQQCPGNLIAATTGGGQIQSCSPQVSGLNSCPSGSSCMQASNAPQQYLCCTQFNTVNTRQPMCPSGYSPSFSNGQVQRCFTSGCFGGRAACMASSNLPGINICCRPLGSTSISILCPRGLSALTTSFGQIEYCNTVGLSCSQPGYTCQAVTSGQRVCCGGSTNNAVSCASGKQPYVVGTGVSFCSAGSNQCPINTNCEASTISGAFICCQTSTTTTVLCTNGQQPLMSANNQPQFCTPGTNSCGFTYSCQTLQNNQYACCAGTTATSGCPNNGELLSPTYACTMGSTLSCPTSTNYQCTQTNLGPRCCRSANSVVDACPNRGQLFANVASCTIGNFNTGCPQNYDCFRLQSGRNRCCSTSSTASQCPNGGTLLDPFTSCTFNSGCPPNYQCLQVGGSINALRCCSGGGTTNLQCPNGGQVVTTVSSCLLGSVNSGCQFGSTCLRLTDGSTRCCTSSNTQQGNCPNGRQLVTSVSFCTVGGFNNGGCPAGSQCFSLSTGLTGCCQSGTITLGTCPNRGQIVTSISGCNILADTCPVQSTCLTLSDNTNQRCCTNPTPVNARTCANGLQAFIENNIPRVCQITNPNCPVGFSCQQSSTSVNQYYCCQGPRCPRGVTIGSNPQQCANTASCPGGFSCDEASNAAGRFICCPLRFRNGVSIRKPNVAADVVLNSINDATIENMMLFNTSLIHWV